MSYRTRRALNIYPFFKRYASALSVCCNILFLLILSRILLADLRQMRHTIKVSHTDGGDGNCSFITLSSRFFINMLLAISAIVIAIQMIAKHCKKLKYRRKIVLVTNGRGDLDADGVAEITTKIKEDDMELVVVYV